MADKHSKLNKVQSLKKKNGPIEENAPIPVKESKAKNSDNNVFTRFYSDSEESHKSFLPNNYSPDEHRMENNQLHNSTIRLRNTRSRIQHVVED
jgi:hypothetical protein